MLYEIDAVTLLLLHNPSKWSSGLRFEKGCGIQCKCLCLDPFCFLNSQPYTVIQYRVFHLLHLLDVVVLLANDRHKRHVLCERESNKQCKRQVETQRIPPQMINNKTWVLITKFRCRLQWPCCAMVTWSPSWRWNLLETNAAATKDTPPHATQGCFPSQFQVLFVLFLSLERLHGAIVFGGACQEESWTSKNWSQLLIYLM